MGQGGRQAARRGDGQGRRRRCGRDAEQRPGGGGVAARRARARGQLLGERVARTPVDVVSALLAVQAQDARVFPLALRARGSGFSRSDVVGSRELVRGWLMRGTLHLVCVEDWWWLHGLTARRSPPERDAAGRLVGDVLASEGPLVRADLTQRLASKGLVLTGQAFPHLLFACCQRGEVVLTPDERYVPAADWVGPPPRGFDRGAALRELGVRYARAHVGADVEDLAGWSGLGKRAAMAAMAATAAATAAAQPASSGVGEEPLPPRLLPAFDPYLLGWKDRSFAVPPELARRVHPGGGIVRAVAVDDGLVGGTWTMPGGRVALDAPQPARYAAEIADVARFEAT